MQALEGLVVVDFSSTLVGTLASQLLSDFGAEVTMVEPPGGSLLRAQPAAPFWLRGKERIELDLKDPVGQARAREHASRADVVIESWRPGVAERLGVGYEDLAADNPGLVYGSVTGFGRRGPFAHLKGYEGVVMAKVGTFGPLQLSSRRGPSYGATPAASFSAAQTLLQGVLAALYERETSGVGQHVETTLWQGYTAHDCWNWLVRTVAGRYPGAFTAVPRVDEARRVPNGWLSFRLLVALSKDGRWLQFSQTSERLWLAFMRVLGLEWMLADPEWKDAHSSDDVDKREAYWEKMLTAVRSKTVAEWYEIFDREPDVFAEIFRRGTELLDHPQMLHDGFVIEIHDPTLGPVVQPGPLVKMQATPAVPGAPAPAPDRHRGSRPAPRTDTPPSGRPPLSGVTVVELGTFYAGPFGSTLLADLGARVIKFERLDGDPMRSIMPFPEVGGVKVLSGKESVAVDIGTDEGRGIVLAAVRSADAVLCSYRAGVTERLGYDDAALLAVNPDLVILHAPGFGVDGPYGHRPAYAPTIGAGAGQAGRNLGEGMVQRPDLSMDEVKDLSLRMGAGAMSGSNPDANASLAVGTALLLGLVARARGAPGQSMLTTMLNSMAHVLSEDMVRYEGKLPIPSVDAEVYGLGPLYRIYPAAQGTWVFLAAPAEREWPDLVKAMASYAALDGDARFDSIEGRHRHASELADALAAIFATRPAAEWEVELTGAGVACVVVDEGPSEATIMLGDRAIAQLEDQLVELEHPVVGQYVRLKPLVGFSRSAGVTPGAPLLGQDTDWVLAQLGYDAAAIAALRARGVIG
jgi:crotonobetainyl-CoA:carnitine CoA-transferase CaiB-like acyl-CoA transferase